MATPRSKSITIEQAFPEPATWAMMLFGFGAIGFAMRRRKQQKTTQTGTLRLFVGPAREASMALDGVLRVQRQR